MDQKQERRQNKRFPVLKAMNIPVTLRLPRDQEIDGILLNLSADGIGLLTFSPLEEGYKVMLSLQLGSLEAHRLEGLVAWSHDLEKVFRLGIHFTRIDQNLARDIQTIADDFLDCQIKDLLGVTDICFTECTYYQFCNHMRKKFF